MNQDNLKALLINAGMTREELAALIGCHIKTTYWPNPPKYVPAILNLHIKTKRGREAIRALTAWINEDEQETEELMYSDD